MYRRGIKGRANIKLIINMCVPEESNKSGIYTCLNLYYCKKFQRGKVLCCRDDVAGLSIGKEICEKGSSTGKLSISFEFQGESILQLRNGGCIKNIKLGANPTKDACK